MPKKIVEKVKGGKELGVVMDELTGQKNIKQHEGTTGYLTKNLVPRAQCFKTTVICALSRFIRPELFE